MPKNATGKRACIVDKRPDAGKARSVFLQFGQKVVFKTRNALVKSAGKSGAVHGQLYIGRVKMSCKNATLKSVNLFAPLSHETRRLLDGIPALIDKTFPLPARFRSKLPSDIAELSRLLTSGRGERSLSYLGRPAMLSAYLRFFLPWNLYRLCRLLPGLDIDLCANDIITDLGSGPFTFACALWICRPDLRHLPLEFQCVDRSGPVLESGKKIFAALVATTLEDESCPWKVNACKAELGAGGLRPAKLVCAANVFNEMYGDISRSGAESLRRNAEKSARLLGNYAAGNCAVLVVEPGFPRCGEFTSLLRGALMQDGYSPLSPCPHGKACPVHEDSKHGKKRWCHFAFATEDAPADLLRLSAIARLPKQRAVLSFVFMGKGLPGKAENGVSKNAVCENDASANNVSILRVISDEFPLPGHKSGRYCCSGKGLVLLAGEGSVMEKTASGSLVSAVFKKGERDAKSGALVAYRA